MTCALCAEPVAECEAISLGDCAACAGQGVAVEAWLRGNDAPVADGAEHGAPAWACIGCVSDSAEIDAMAAGYGEL